MALIWDIWLFYNHHCFLFCLLLFRIQDKSNWWNLLPLLRVFEILLSRDDHILWWLIRLWLILSILPSRWLLDIALNNGLFFMFIGYGVILLQNWRLYWLHFISGRLARVRVLDAYFLALNDLALHREHQIRGSLAIVVNRVIPSRVILALIPRVYWKCLVACLNIINVYNFSIFHVVGQLLFLMLLVHLRKGRSIIGSSLGEPIWRLVVL